MFGRPSAADRVVSVLQAELERLQLMYERDALRWAEEREALLRQIMSLSGKSFEEDPAEFVSTATSRRDDNPYLRVDADQIVSIPNDLPWAADF